MTVLENITTLLHLQSYVMLNGMKGEIERIKETARPSRYFTGIHLEGQRKTTKRTWQHIQPTS
jgi:hypothetical protein